MRRTIVTALYAVVLALSMPMLANAGPERAQDLLEYDP